MSKMIESLVTYLHRTKGLLSTLNGDKKVTIVLGNEACDLDSAVCAITYAFLLNYNNPAAYVIPVLNINDEDYALRTEITYLFVKLQIQKEFLVFKNEINLKELQENENLSLILVDHNSLKSSDQFLWSSVVEIIDHHEITNTLIDGSVDVTIEKVGSCSTLIAELYVKLDRDKIDENIIFLLYSTILLDTVNKSPAAKKVTDKDIEVLKMLKKIIPDIKDDELFKSLQQAKADVEDLTSTQILRKDLKDVCSSFLKIGISSVPISADNFLKRNDAFQALKHICDVYDYQVLIIMAIQVFETEVKRQISVFSKTDCYRHQVEELLENANAPNLELEELDVVNQNLTLYNQRNTSASRKVILPLINKFLVGEDSPLSPQYPNQNISFSQVDRNESPENSNLLLNMIPSETPPSSGVTSRSSGPYTPQNSLVGSNIDIHAASYILPSFNNRETVDKILHKRGEHGDAMLNSNVPFTPKNSFVDESSMDRFLPYNVLDYFQSSQELVEKVHRKKNFMINGLDENEPPYHTDLSSSHGKGLKMDEMSRQKSLGYHSGSTDDGVGGEPVDKTKEGTTGQEQIAAVNNNNTSFQKTFQNRENENQDAINQVEIDPIEASTYTAQTVDFPDSPHQLKLLQQQSLSLHGLKLEDEYVEENIINESSSINQSSNKAERPVTLDPLMQPAKRKILIAPDILSSKDDDQRSISSISNHSDTDMFSRCVDDLMTPDDIDTPDDLDESILERFGSLESDTIPELSAAEEYAEERSWRTCFISGIERKIDLKVIEPYKKVLSHGGYFGENKNAIILFSACYLPDRSRRDYDYVMDNLFLYVLTTLDTLVAEDYILIYLHGATQRSNMPSFGWLKRCYQMIDRRLRKNLKQLFLVHPSFWVKTIVIMTRPFISSKFSRKLKFINNLQELGEVIPLDDVCIPDKVKQYDEAKALEEVN